MRRNRSIASSLGLAALLVVCGCTDLLQEDPKGFTTTDTFYKTGADLNSATIAIYNSLRGMQGQGQWTTLELASDQARADTREPNLGTSGPDFLIWDASTGNTGAYWGTAYSMITRANLVLANGPGIDAPNAQIKAYNLAEAKAALPATWPSSDGYGNPTQGRVTKGAAQMALADLYQWRSSFMKQNEWQLASDWADSVIRSGVWALNNDYLSTFLPQNKGNKEMILVITNSGVTTNTRSLFQLFYYPRDWGLDQGQGGGWGLIHPTTWFFNSYRPGDYRRGTDTGWASTSAYVWGGCSVSSLCPTFNDTVKHVIRHDTLADGPMPYKYRKSDNGVNWMLNDVDTPLYRYAEAILMYAEAQNELGNTGVAVQYLNLTRARARGRARRTGRSPTTTAPPASRWTSCRCAMRSTWSARGSSR